MQLRIEHKTLYQYATPVQLGPHRIMVRPMEGHDVQIRSSELSIQPAYQVRWIHDVFGNSIAVLNFDAPTQFMEIISNLVVEQYNTNPFDFVLDPNAYELPFAYDRREEKDVAPYILCEYPEDMNAVYNWMQPFLGLEGKAKTIDFLTSLNKSFPLFFQYARREEPGVQTPGETLKHRSGSCRDFALLLMEAARQKGLAARFVSGYLCHSDDQTSDQAYNATHAWAEIYLPGAGWKGFDPTCGILAADLHVRVAVARHPDQASPVSGTFQGRGSDYLGLTVTVNARTVPEIS